MSESGVLERRMLYFPSTSVDVPMEEFLTKMPTKGSASPVAASVTWPEMRVWAWLTSEASISRVNRKNLCKAILFEARKGKRISLIYQHICLDNNKVKY